MHLEKIVNRFVFLIEDPCHVKIDTMPTNFS